MTRKKSKVSGIYCIENTLNDKVYIGSASDIRYRWKNHRSDLNTGKHHSLHLQRSWNKNPAAFVFSILEVVCNESVLLTREQWWIDMLDCCNLTRCYNINPVAAKPPSLKGRKYPPRSELTKQRLSESHKGKATHWSSYHGFRDPSGDPIVITNITRFCRENKIDRGCLYRLISGKYKSYKGWTYNAEEEIA